MITKTFSHLSYALLLSTCLLSCTKTPRDSKGSDTIPQPSPAQKTKILLIFCDVTNSLREEESREAAKISADILDQQPANTEYIIYPIQIQTRLMPHIVKASVPLQLLTSQIDDYKLKKAERRKEILDKVQQLYKDMNDRLHNTDNRTCILNSIAFAENYFRDYTDTAKFELELIYVSDMIEECNSTLLGRRVEMDKRDISGELRLAQAFQCRYRMPHVSVKVFYPSTKETLQASQRLKPDVEQLKQFWEMTFNHCGVAGIKFNF
jgi:hypothetical protein